MIRYTLYLVRHGQTEDNVAERLTGQRDSALTPLGEAQAIANGHLLKTMVDAAACDFVASPLGRARRTMELVRGAMGLPVDDYRTDPRLMEADYGDSHGRPWAEAHAIRKAIANGDPWNTPHPGGESRAQLYARAVAFLHSVQRDTVVVSHGGTVRMIRGALLKLDNDEIVGFAALNAGVIEISAAGERLHGR